MSVPCWLNAKTLSLCGKGFSYKPPYKTLSFHAGDEFSQAHGETTSAAHQCLAVEKRLARPHRNTSPVF